MKHVFIVNSHAGTKEKYSHLRENLIPFSNSGIIEIHETTKPKDATEIVKNYLTTHPCDEVRFYSCGGDGTLSEVVNGVVGYQNASICLYPSGSGNDFVKSVGGAMLYEDIEHLLSAENKEIDLIKITDSNGQTAYCINIVNCGFDAIVAKKANEIKDKGGKHSYTKGLVYALFKAMKNQITVEADGETINPLGKILLCSVANGGWYGGKYFCAPRYKLDDGEMEVCLVKPTSVFNFLRLVGKYKDGKHLNNKKFENLISYKRAKTVKMISETPFAISVDGEIIVDKEFSIEIMPKALKFAIPHYADQHDLLK